MVLENQNILFFTRTMKLGGTENVVLQLCEILKPLVNKIVVCSCGGVNVEKLTAMGIKHYEIPDIEQKKPQQMLTVARTLKKIVREENITVIHTHHRMAAFYACVLGMSEKLYLLSSVHGEFYDKKFLTKLSYSRSHIIACGEMVKENLVSFFGIKKEIIVLRNSVNRDTSPIECIPELQIYRENGYKLVGYIGRLSEEKGVLYLSRSLVHFPKDTKIIYVVTGAGNMKTEMDQILTDNHCGDKVVYLGYRSDPQNVIRQLDCIIMPSLTEGLPLTPMEAFAHGKPVIATSVGGNLELIRNRENGILIPPKESHEIARAVSELLTDRILYERCAENAQKDYDTKFSIEAFEKKLINIYESL